MTIFSLIHDLRASLGSDRVITPDSKKYEDAIRRWADSSSKKAGAVVYPTSNREVSTAVTLATKNSVSLTVAGGTHSTGGDASITDGLVIDLRRMRSVSVDPSEKTIACGGGCLWRDVDFALAEHSLATIGGTVNQTGIGGLTLGGGYGFLSGQLGLALDRLIEAEVVLADGRIVTCSATKEPDLFWAIRGAGHAFGVTTQFVFQAVEQKTPIYGGMAMWPATPDAITHLVNFANSIATASPSDGRTAMLVGFTTAPRPTPDAPLARVVFGVCFFNGPKSEGEKVFAPLLDNPPVPTLLNTLEEMPYHLINESLKAAAVPGGRRVSKGATFQPPLPPSLFLRVLAAYEDIAKRIPEAGETGVCLFEFYASNAICAVGHEETAFSNRGTHQNAMIIPRWNSEEHDEEMRRFARETMELCAETIADQGQASGEYLNYDGIGTPASKIFGKNYARLRELKGRYDPTNVFAKKHGLRGPDPAPEQGAHSTAAVEKGIAGVRVTTEAVEGEA